MPELRDRGAGRAPCLCFRRCSSSWPPGTLSAPSKACLTGIKGVTLPPPKAAVGISIKFLSCPYNAIIKLQRFCLGGHRVGGLTIDRMHIFAFAECAAKDGKHCEA